MSGRASASATARLTALGVAVVIAAAACGSPPPSATPAGSHDPVASTTPGTTTRSASPAAPTPIPTPSATPGPHLDAATAAALQQTLDAMRTRGAYPGMAAAVIFPDGSTWSGASGLAVVSPARPLTPDTLFSVGSITKTYVAAFTLQLAGRGRLGLDDPLSRYVPTFPNAAHITLRELLSHTSGIQDLFSAPGMAAAILAQPARLWKPSEVLAKIGRPYFAPGKGYHYSNTNYLLLGLVLEKVTGMSVGAAVRQAFLAPLSLDATFFQSDEKPAGPLAHGYRGPAARPQDVSARAAMLPFAAEVTAAGASGEVAASVTDVARWASLLYGGWVIDRAALATMTDTSITAPFHPRYAYGLGFEQATLNGHVAWGHRGHLDGFWAAMDYLPDSRLTVAVVTNADWADPLAPSAALIAVALSGGKPAPSPSSAPAVTPPA